MRISDWSSDVCSSDLRRDRVETGDPRDFLDDVGRAVHVAAPARHRHLPAAALFDHRKTERGEDVLLPLGRDRDAAERRRQRGAVIDRLDLGGRSEEHTSELQSLMRISYAVFCLKKKNINKKTQ